jgi:hypothetical protein
MQVQASDVGATLPGMTGDKQQQFIYELVEAYSRVSTAVHWPSSNVH